jgi:hypothetical protein
MDKAEFDQRWRGLYAMQQYLLENVETDIITGEEIYDFMIGSAELVRDAGGDMHQYIDSIIDTLSCTDPVLREQLREELWTKLFALP